MISRIDHVAVAVTSLEQGLEFWAETLGLEVAGIETIAAEGVKVAFLKVGESRIELLEPLGDDSTVARFLKRRGGGLHHLTLQVDDIDQALEQARSGGARVLGDAPRSGAGGHRVAFLHPQSTGGVLLELVQRRSGTSGAADAIAPGSVILAYLRDPTEKLWGELKRLDLAGLEIEAIDVGSFDDFVAQVERGEDSVVGPSRMFVPIGRVEKLLLDRSSGHLPSLAERFRRRVGRTLPQVIVELNQAND